MVLSPATAAPEAGANSTLLMQMVSHLRRSKNKLLLLLSANGLGKIKEKNKMVLTEPCHVVNSKITFGHGQAIKQ